MKPQHYYSPNLFRSDYPFSHGTFVDLGTKTMVFLAGTISMGKDSFIDGDAFKQAEVSMQNIKTSLEEVGGTFRDIVKVIIFSIDQEMESIEKCQGFQLFPPSPQPPSHRQKSQYIYPATNAHNHYAKLLLPI